MTYDGRDHDGSSALSHIDAISGRKMPITNPYIAAGSDSAAAAPAAAVANDAHKSQCSIEETCDPDKGLHVQVHRRYQAHMAEYWWDTIVSNARWFRVKYKSGRFGKQCSTPCYTTFYGGRTEYQPYEPVPDWLQPLVEEVSRDLNMSVPFNAMLLRLYFDGDDNIEWHTDGRVSLGNAPTIASLSFGANATFEMRRMHNVWPPLDGSAGDCIDRTTAQRNFVVGDGDMLVMLGATQKHWHHRVPKEKGRMPRLNINFRMILGGPDAERGQKTYYKYMVHGDEESPKSFSYEEIMKMRGGMMNFVAKPKSEHISTSEKSKDEKKSATTASTEHQSEELEVNTNTPSKAASDVTLYLAAENVDEATFMSLPEEIRKELVSTWKSRKMVDSASATGLKRAHENRQSTTEKITAGCKRSKGGNGPSGVGGGNQKKSTLDMFFNKK